MSTFIRSLFFKVLLVLILLFVIVVVFSLINAKNFDLEFKVDHENSTIDVEKVQLVGRLIKFPFNIYHINGSLIIGSNSYDLKNYDYGKVFNSIEIIDKDKLGSFGGKAKLTGDIFSDNVKSMYISASTVDMSTGKSHGEHINSTIIK